MGPRIFAAFISACFGTAYHVALVLMPGLFFKSEALHLLGDTTAEVIDSVAMTWLIFFLTVAVIGIPVSLLARFFCLNSLVHYLVFMYLGFVIASAGLEPVGSAFGGFGWFGLWGSLRSLFLIIPFWYIVEGGPRR